MSFPPPPGPSPPDAAFAAPLITPVLAIPLAALLPGIYTSGLDLILVVPFVVVISLLYGYLGMLLICLPIAALLIYTEKLNAVRLCFYTTIAGAGVWTYWATDSASPDFLEMARYFVVGSGCSLGVAGFFCVLDEIPILSTQGQHAAKD